MPARKIITLNTVFEAHTRHQDVRQTYHYLPHFSLYHSQ